MDTVPSRLLPQSFPIVDFSSLLKVVVGER